MLVEFDEISNDARLWIYAADKKLTIDQESYILNYISNFLKDWQSHSSPLKSKELLDTVQNFAKLVP